jgi:NAD-dependent SIR2 family protein deacetylase
MPKCPSCQLEVDKEATTCPYCKEAILSFDKGKNAFLQIFWYIVLFVLLYKGITWYVNRESDKEMKKMEREIERREY